MYTAVRVPTVPPDKGSFPLDHEGACKLPMKTLFTCLKEFKGENIHCRSQSLDYLKCRMEQ
jgi:cytochrome c oxidase assembly protein subunit 19